MTGAEEMDQGRKLKVLCLHGFRTSATILRQQLGKWNDSIHELLDLTFLDAPYIARGKSDVEAYFPPPYYEWFQYNKDFTEYENLENTIEFITNFMSQNGPFDGLLGFSQGAILASALVGMQEKGHALEGLPPVRFVISICGAKLIATRLEYVYLDPIRCPSIHFIGDKDWLRNPGEELLQAYKNPELLRFPQGHTVPRLDDNSINKLRNFLVEHGTIKENEYHHQQVEDEVSRQEICVHA